MIRKIAALLLTAALMITGLALPASAEGAAPETATVTPAAYRHSLPSDMRAAFITPSVDFFTDSSVSSAALNEELADIYAEFAETGLNTVIINTVCDGKAYYTLGASEGAPDPVLAAVKAAYEHGISPFVVFDLGQVLSDCGPGAEAADTLISRTHRFVLKYACTGIIIDDYYAKRDTRSYAGYMENGSGVGYTNYLYDTAEQYFRTAADVIRRTDNTVAAGILINDMWANASSREDGSDTEDYFQAYYDGYSDTRSYVESGSADFVMVRAYGSITSKRLPFEKVAGWWGDIASRNDIPMYIVHHNEYIGTETVGWGGVDQLLKQLSVAKDIAAYSGSAFNSLSSLKKDPLGTTGTLKAYFREQINEQSLFEDLKMTSPASLTYTTTEASVTFMGSFDSNFPVTFNGEAIKLNDAGNFYFEKPLSAGLNTFTISHKSKTYTYNITRKITVLREIGAAISEDKTLSVDGGTRITLTARAYKGAAVYASVNGSTVNMSETEGTADEDDVNSSYRRFTGYYTVPKGIVGQIQELGRIKIFASYSGYSMEAVGASVRVNAEPEPVQHNEAVITEDESSAGSGEVIGTLEAPHSSEDAVTFVRVLNDYTITYDGKTADDIPSPLFSQLPAGSLEIYKSTSGSYYVTESGKRIAMSASTLEDGEAITENSLTVKSVGTSNGSGYIKLRLDHRTGFNIRAACSNYYTAWDGDYYLDSFNATHVYITFENVTKVTALPSFEYNQVFRSAKWDTVTEANGTKFRLILELRQPGVYCGHKARYDDNGDLILSFPVPVNTLSGMTIVVDPGHGYGKRADVFDPGAIGEVVEEEVVLEIAKELTEQLKAAGANVIRLKTESEFLLTRERPNVARGLGCDMFLSVHANKATGDARGVEAYYFTSYSQPLAAAISKNIAKYYQNSVYSDGADKNRGARYSYYHVTLQQDFPSVLIETGFVDNVDDAMALASAAHRKGIAAAIVTGIKEYLARSSISYASEGYSAADAGAGETTLPAVTETTAAETEAPTETTEPAVSETSDTEDTSAETTLPPETEDTSAAETSAESTEPETTPGTTASPAETTTVTTTENTWHSGGFM
ncbi:MAG: N-acetylmuramoyl-L-alanine amidase [Ruminiclostridium sp.]|nr:N-acetylmuramoyl-L-alanine amidase [Ruminiclostridium sp.]